eukprot:CAMPEP_0184341038 /NCGR_PEP_ID=MMETSP1089-20130417/9681_1 /TAXON_ID=38269 ORGANISM="Gloeochaete wittrockiana, Strain SAG46.84" /NCGR_SAMPLE_ID=MMETSP1089 /ASSEMBLY_ACC=CAM_ASM_000445 /LENGTH=208 /DNA_ID=CAMNT_0026669143 /DNA_START=70 /DNA_END=693 /DNA_ORIENTATION=-
MTDRPRTNNLKDERNAEKENPRRLKIPSFFNQGHPNLTEEILNDSRNPNDATSSRLVPLGTPPFNAATLERQREIESGNFFASHPAAEAIAQMRVVAPGSLPYHLTYDLIGSGQAGLPLQTLDVYHHQKALRLAIILNLTDECFKTCVPLRIPGRFSADHVNCMHYCVRRRLESDIYVTNRMTNELSGLDFNNIDLQMPSDASKKFFK